MAILKPVIDYTLVTWPKTEQDWKDNPEVIFTTTVDRNVIKGDRLYLQTKMMTSGLNSGNIVDVQYILMDIKQVIPLTTLSDEPKVMGCQYTVTAKRVEV